MESRTCQGGGTHGPFDRRGIATPCYSVRDTTITIKAARLSAKALTHSRFAHVHVSRLFYTHTRGTKHANGYMKRKKKQFFRDEAYNKLIY